MNFARFSFILLVPILVVAGSGTLSGVTETERTREAMNTLRAAWLGNIVPRNSGGVAENNAGSLGTDDYKWAGIYIDYANGANGGLRQYAKYFTIDQSGSLSTTSTSTSYIRSDEIPDGSSITNAHTKPILVTFTCDFGSAASVRSEDNLAVGYVRLGRLVGGVETYLTTWSFEYNRGQGADMHWPTSTMTYIDTSPPTTAFQYIIDIANADISGNPDFDLNSCVQAVSF